MSTGAVEYVGKDLEAMDLAVNYHEWIYSLMRPYLGRRIVEVGAGTGGFAELLWRHESDALTLIEPSSMFDALERRIASKGGGERVKLIRGLFSEVVRDVAADRPDTIVYNNVLEHVKDDARELELVRDVLEPGGRVLIFVPAGRLLFSDFDRNLGHFRRYTRGELVGKIRAAGFSVRGVRNVDSLGVIPWLIKYRIMRSTSMEPGMVRLYDRMAVPLLRRVEALLRPPFGKNLFVVGEKA